jgi:polyhydroxyalkanoate synthase
VIGDFAARQAKSGQCLAVDELGIGKAFMEVAAKMLANPYRMAETQMNLWWNYMNLWQASTIKLLSGAPSKPRGGDKRFRHENWEQHFCSTTSNKATSSPRKACMTPSAASKASTMRRHKVNFFRGNTSTRSRPRISR